jgi:hypothetical protein
VANLPAIRARLAFYSAPRRIDLMPAGVYREDVGALLALLDRVAGGLAGAWNLPHERACRGPEWGKPCGCAWGDVERVRQLALAAAQGGDRG